MHSISDVEGFLKAASQKLGGKIYDVLVFNEVSDVRARLEKCVGNAEGAIRKYAERFCNEEQHTPQEDTPQEDTPQGDTPPEDTPNIDTGLQTTV